MLSASGGCVREDTALPALAATTGVRVDLVPAFARAGAGGAGQLTTRSSGPGSLAGDVVFAEDLADGLDGSWISGNALLGDSPGAATHGVIQDRATGTCLLMVRPAAAGLHLFLPARGHEGYELRWRCRKSTGTAASRAVVHVLTSRQPPPGEPTGEEARRRVRGLLQEGRDPEDVLSHHVEPVPDDQWRSGSLWLPPEMGRKSLHVCLEAEGGDLLVESLALRRLDPLQCIARESPALGSELVRRLKLPAHRADGLVLPAGARVRQQVSIPAAAPRLDASVLGLGTARGAAIVLELLLDGARVAQMQVTAVPWSQEWQDWVVPLDAFAGREVSLELRASGDADTVALLAGPAILAAASASLLPNVVLISLDTLRADALGCYGSPTAVTPAIDALARQGILFERALSPSSYTLPTHATLMTGQHPLEHGVVRRERRIDPARSDVLAEVLRHAGYVTAAFTGGGYVDPDFGFERGFAWYSTRDVAGQDPGSPEPERVQQVQRWVERHRDQSFFLFLHTYLVHAYRPEIEFARRFGAGEAAARRNESALQEEARRGSEDAARQLRALYDATVAQADATLVAPLLATLDALDLRSRTFVVLVSDHGEAFLEHGTTGHGKTLWSEVTHVPLLLSGPGIPAGERRSGLVQLGDVAPTVLELLELPALRDASGRSLLRPLADAPDLVLHLDTARTSWEGLVAEPWKLLRRIERGAPAATYLFRLDRDPGESEDLAAQEPAQTALLGRRLDAARARLGALHATQQPEESPLSAALEHQLRELGYAQDD